MLQAHKQHPPLLFQSLKSSDDASNTAMESASSSRDVPSSSLSPKLAQRTLKRVSSTGDSSCYPIPGLPPDTLHMRVREGSKIRNLLRFATARMQGEVEDGKGSSLRQVVFTGSGRGVTKTITCVEILKRRVEGLHQVSKLYYKTEKEISESQQQGAPSITVPRTVPAICILLSKDPLDPQEPGYQPPRTPGSLTEDVESCRAVIRPAHGASSQCTAKRVCLGDWSVCSPQLSNV